MYVKGYACLSFAENMGQNLGRKYEYRLFDSTKKLAIDALRTTLIRAIQKMAERTFDLVSNKIAEKITKAASKTTCEDPSTSSSQINGKISNEDARNELHITRKVKTNY